MGDLLFSISRFEEAKTYYKEAITHSKTALKIYPNSANIYIRLGSLLARKQEISLQPLPIIKLL